MPLFRCRGCGSEWVRSEPWAPVDANGARHPVLVEELARREDEAAQAGRRPGSSGTIVNDARVDAGAPGRLT